tara:strand:- start:5146 stop:5973 length:828 start_codon:yes stop_codon:yes gene_type:complete
MANKGNQFEWAVMYHALSRVGDPAELSQDQRKTLDSATSQIATMGEDNPISVAGRRVIDDIKPGRALQSFYKSFEKYGGGADEGKTDIAFRKDGTTYKCSMKYGDSFQLTSAGIDTSVNVLTNILRLVAEKYGTRSDAAALGYLQLVLEDISNTFENAKGTITATEADRLMTNVRKNFGLQARLQSILGTRKNPTTAGVYSKFKYELTKECLTGEMTFNNSEKVATHVLTETGVVPIDDSLINEIMGKAGVRISKKGRKSKGGVKMNAITIRYEV